MEMRHRKYSFAIVDTLHLLFTKKSEPNLNNKDVIPSSLHRDTLTSRVSSYYVKRNLHESRLIKLHHSGTLITVSLTMDFSNLWKRSTYLLMFLFTLYKTTPGLPLAAVSVSLCLSKCLRSTSGDSKGGLGVP